MSQAGTTEGLRRARRILAAFAILLATALAGWLSAPSAPAAKVGDGRGGVELKRIGGFDQPVYVTAPRDYRRVLFVVEQPGQVKLWRRGKTRGTFLDIRSIVRSGGEEGLLSIAFDPNFRKTGLFYAYYTNNQGNIRIDQFRRHSKRPGTAPAGTRRKVIEIRHPIAANHNGGQLQFGPDHKLWIGTGDGGGSGDQFDNARKRTSLLGKLLRIKPRRRGGYVVPKGNPFIGRKGKPEIYSIGLRNPWRFSFDRKSGHLMLADVGQNAIEEVNLVSRKQARGANFGWPQFEGNQSFDPNRKGPGPLVRPIHTYRHEGGACSITGGYIVRDRRLRSLYGRYLYADFCEGTLRSLVPRFGGARHDRSTGFSLSTPTSFGEDNRGRVFVTLAGGDVLYIAPK